MIEVVIYNNFWDNLLMSHITFMRNWISTPIIYHHAVAKDLFSMGEGGGAELLGGGAAAWVS